MGHWQWILDSHVNYWVCVGKDLVVLLHRVKSETRSEKNSPPDAGSPPAKLGAFSNGE